MCGGLLPAASVCGTRDYWRAALGFASRPEGASTLERSRDAPTSLTLFVARHGPPRSAVTTCGFRTIGLCEKKHHVECTRVDRPRGDDLVRTYTSIKKKNKTLKTNIIFVLFLNPAVTQRNKKKVFYSYNYLVFYKINFFKKELLNSYLLSPMDNLFFI